MNNFKETQRLEDETMSLMQDWSMLNHLTERDIQVIKEQLHSIGATAVREYADAISKLDKIN